MDTLITDIILLLTNSLDDINKIKLLSVTKSYHELKNKIIYNNKIKYNKINHLWYYDRFINVVVNKITILPKLITHLTFGYLFNQDIKGSIPESVTHLTFGSHFNQD